MTDSRKVFFYGLFMDESLLASKGIHPGASRIAYVDGFSLQIGERATLVPDAACRAHGVLMEIAAEDIDRLYAEPGVADYIAQPVVVTLSGGIREPADCYNLPAEKLEGANAEYAAALLALATKLGLPDEYLGHIRQQQE